MDRTCATCGYWDVRTAPSVEQIGRGVCRRWPPMPDPTPASPGLDQYRRSFEKQGLWPITTGADGCGEHTEGE